jgi:isopentenyl-diphosphate delta-isomerase
MEYVVLVNPKDEILGEMEKMQAHEAGVLHRAFSVFIFNGKQELLLQKRAIHKYHSGGLWTNTCCGHPRPAEAIEDAARRRLKEEMGFTTALTFKEKFIYKADLANTLIEHELDYIFTGLYNGEMNINPDEVAACRWIKQNDLELELATHPEIFTYWFHYIFHTLKIKFFFEKQ